jgi:hypothetical protein
MRNLGAVLVLGGVLLFPSQSAQACHGRKVCSLCASRARCYGGYGYSNQWYGGGYTYGYGMACVYAYPTGSSTPTCTTASRDPGAAKSNPDTAVSETTPGRSLDRRLDELDRKFAALQKSLEDYKGEVTNQINQKAEESRKQFMTELKAELDARNLKKPG